MTADELAEINQVARTTGNDVILDALLLRLHTETACRRGGALALRSTDLDADRGLVRLCEKGETLRWQPISPALAAALAHHATCRGAVLPTDALLRYRHGAPLTSRRYDHLWRRIGQHLPWVAAQGVSTHWLRHTTLTWVARHFGYGIARAYAGHTDTTGPATATYIKADLQAVATALASMTGQPHPMATTSTGPTSHARYAEQLQDTDCNTGPRTPRINVTGPKRRLTPRSPAELTPTGGRHQHHPDRPVKTTSRPTRSGIHPRLREPLAEYGYDPDHLGQLVDLAAVGITARWVAQYQGGGLARRRGHRRPLRRRHVPHQYPHHSQGESATAGVVPPTMAENLP